MAKALVNGKMITWGRERSTVALDDFASSFGVKPERLREWESGKERPTINQAKALAKRLKIPFGYLFLKKPPEELPHVPDLRTIGSAERTSFSPDFIDVYQSSLLKQQWFKEYRLREGFPKLPFAGLFNRRSAVADIVASIEDYLQVSFARSEANDDRKFMTLLVDNAEKLGILVFRSGTVGSNTHRLLSVDEFRGFAIHDEYTPVVFINTQDSRSAQVFSLMHELAHIWIGEDGVSNYDTGVVAHSSISTVESKCNQVAAEVLVPSFVIKSSWNNSETVSENIRLLSKRCKVSKMVVAIRAHDVSLISRQEFSRFYGEELKWDKKQKKRQKDSSGGGPKTEVMINLRNGKLFAQTLVSETYEGRVLFGEALSLLGMKKIDSLNNYHQVLNKRNEKAA